MINASDFTDELIRRNFGLVSCVPCSLLKPLINQTIMDKNLFYISAVSEGEAVGIAVGSSLAGKTGVVMLQNSGLGNIVNPVTSLTNIYRIPVLFIISLRGEPGIKEAIQHKIMGKITNNLLELMNIHYENFPEFKDQVVISLEKLQQRMIEHLLPTAFIVRKNKIQACELSKNILPLTSLNSNYHNEIKHNSDRPTRQRVIKEISKLIKEDDLIISATGGISRELSTECDRPGNFYMQGSMGTTAAIGLGVALIRPDKSVIVLDGDGSVLMRMGSLATVGYYNPTKYIHVVLDNESYETTGGQYSVSSRADLSKIATSAGYRRSVTVSNIEALQDYWQQFYNESGPSFINVKVKKENSQKVKRPSLTPEQICKRFMSAIASTKMNLP